MICAALSPRCVRIGCQSSGPVACSLARALFTLLPPKWVYKEGRASSSSYLPTDCSSQHSLHIHIHKNDTLISRRLTPSPRPSLLPRIAMPLNLASLPFEIIEAIARYLAKADASSLSMTCRDIRTPAQKALFRSVTVTFWRTRSAGLNTTQAVGVMQTLKAISEASRDIEALEASACGSFVCRLNIKYNPFRLDKDDEHDVCSDEVKDQLALLDYSLTYAGQEHILKPSRVNLFLNTLTTLLKTCPYITVLTLGNCDLVLLDDGSVAIPPALADLTEQASSLTRLTRFSYNSAHKAGASLQYLLPAIWPKLSTLDINFARLDAYRLDQAIPFAGPLTTAGLVELVVTFPGLALGNTEQRVWDWLGRILAITPFISNITLSHCSISSGKFSMLCSASLLPRLARLSLTFNAFELNSAALDILHQAPNLAHLILDFESSECIQSNILDYLPASIESVTLLGVGSFHYSHAVSLFNSVTTLITQAVCPAGFRNLCIDISIDEALRRDQDEEAADWADCDDEEASSDNADEIEDGDGNESEDGNGDGNGDEQVGVHAIKQKSEVEGGVQDQNEEQPYIEAVNKDDSPKKAENSAKGEYQKKEQEPEKEEEDEHDSEGDEYSLSGGGERRAKIARAKTEVAINELLHALKAKSRRFDVMWFHTRTVGRGVSAAPNLF